MRSGIIFVLAMLAVGCQSYDVRIYNLTVKNQSAGPITIWLTKDGPPYEPGWLAPEDIAIESPKGPDRVIGGVIIPKGKTANTGPIRGEFQPGTHAMLRVYGGKLSFAELLASSADARNRVDLQVHPGKSAFTVTGNPSEINVDETDEPNVDSTSEPATAP